jgi:hypothetical protein
MPLVWPWIGELGAPIQGPTYHRVTQANRGCASVQGLILAVGVVQTCGQASDEGMVLPVAGFPLPRHPTRGTMRKNRGQTGDAR